MALNRVCAWFRAMKAQVGSGSGFYAAAELHVEVGAVAFAF
jgi:hypothetical protein